MNFKKIKELKKDNEPGELLDTCKIKVELSFYRHLVAAALLAK
jgi:hypothetical protein